MCGLAGIFRVEGAISEGEQCGVKRMLDAQVHRGPDAEGLKLLHPVASRQLPVACLGHRRLAILDLSEAGHQPMCNEDQTVWIIYNGEIYNFAELRRELVAAGHVFKSRTDTEVLIHGYEQWNIEGLLPRLCGMYAFALYDSRQDRLFLVRDRFGIKPLYYYQDSEKIVFASEVRALVGSGLVPAERNEEALIRFLQLGSIPVPLTTLKNVYALPSAHYLMAEKRNTSLHEYWSLESAIDPGENHGHVTSSLRALLETSVREHLVSDVPLGVFLSGGIDSSVLVALASRFRERPVTTLSVVFAEADYSEAPYARRVAAKYETDHREVMLGGNEFIEELPHIFSAMDQPSVDGVNTYFVVKAARSAGLTVVLSGAGGDEVFLGYDHLKRAARLNGSWDLFRKIPPWVRRGLIGAAVMGGKMAGRNGLEKLHYLQEPSPENFYLASRGLFTPHQIQELCGLSTKELSFDAPAVNGQRSAVGGRRSAVSGRRSAASTLASSVNLLEFDLYLQNQLLKDTDVMSMAHSVETRVPFLDHRLVEYVINLPPRLKIGDANKALLVDAMGDALPREVWDRRKMGFTFPFALWLRKRAEEIKEDCFEETIFERDTVKRVWDGFIRGRVHWSRPWALTVAARCGR